MNLGAQSSFDLFQDYAESRYLLDQSNNAEPDHRTGALLVISTEPQGQEDNVPL